MTKFDKQSTPVISDSIMLIANGIIWITLSLGVMLAGFTIPFQTNHDLIPLSIYATSTLISLYIGMPVVAKLSQKIEKRQLILIGLVLFGLSCIISFLIAENFNLLVVFRFVGGFGLSSLLILVPNYVSENLSNEKRERGMYLLDLFWPLGYMVGSILSVLILGGLIPKFNAIYLVCGVISLVSVVVISVFPTNKNTKYSPDLNELPDDDKKSKVVKQIDQKKSNTSTQNMVNASWILMNFVYYSIFIWAPLIIISQFQNNFTFTIVGLVLFGTVQLPSQALGNFILERVSSLKLFMSSILICILCLFAISFLNNAIMLILIWTIVAGANMISWASLYPLTNQTTSDEVSSEKAEYYGKLAAVFAPLVVAFLGEIFHSFEIAVLGVSIISLLTLLGVFSWSRGLSTT